MGPMGSDYLTGAEPSWRCLTGVGLLPIAGRASALPGIAISVDMHS